MYLLNLTIVFVCQTRDVITSSLLDHILKHWPRSIKVSIALHRGVSHLTMTCWTYGAKVFLSSFPYHLPPLFDLLSIMKFNREVTCIKLPSLRVSTSLYKLNFFGRARFCIILMGWFGFKHRRNTL